MKSRLLFTPTNIFIALFILLLSNNLLSQNRSFATLPLAKSDTLIRNSIGDLNHTRDYEKILKIYNNL